MTFNPLDMFLETAVAINEEFTIGVAKEAATQLTGHEFNKRMTKGKALNVIRKMADELEDLEDVEE